MPADQPTGHRAAEKSPHSKVLYLYVVKHEDGQRVYYSNYDVRINVVNIHAAICPEGEMVFQPSNIRHGGITNNDRFEERSVNISLDTTDQRLRRYLTVAAATELWCWIIRIGIMEVEEDDEVDFAENAFIAEYGILSRFSYSREGITAQVTPPPMNVNFKVGRHWFQQTCNHVLFGPFCQVNKDSFKLVTTISAIDPANKTVTIAGRKSGGAADYFEAGYFDHPATSNKYAIWKSEFAGTTETKLHLGYWHPELAVGQSLTAFAGCKHTTADCKNKFNNAANFGGFPFIPRVNPQSDGVD